MVVGIGILGEFGAWNCTSLTAPQQIFLETNPDLWSQGRTLHWIDGSTSLLLVGAEDFLLYNTSATDGPPRLVANATTPMRGFHPKSDDNGINGVTIVPFDAGGKSFGGNRSKIYSTQIHPDTPRYMYTPHVVYTAYMTQIL